MKNYYIPHIKQGLILSLVVMGVKIPSRLKAMDKKTAICDIFCRNGQTG